jgi:hypothetical protein
MKLLQKIILGIILVIGIGLTIALPFNMIYSTLFKGQALKAIINFGAAFLLLIFLFIWLLWLRRIYYRKLDAIATVEEMGAKTQTNFIVVRLLKTMEYILPFAFLALFMKGLTYVQIPPQKIFVDILWAMGAGVIVFLFHDGLRNYFITQNQITNALKLDEDKDKLKTKIKIKMERKNKEE